MAAKRKIFKTGHSAAVTLSAKLLKELGWKIGDTVAVETGSGKEQIVIKPARPNTQLPLELNLRKRLGSVK